MLQSMGERFQTLVGTEYDIIAFDPRGKHRIIFFALTNMFLQSGVGETTPPVFGFKDSAERETWSLLEPALINATSDALSKRIARAHVLNSLIKKRSGDIAQHVNSATVARDMLSIVHAHGHNKLQYWGQSYGATLGVTFVLSLYSDCLLFMKYSVTRSYFQ